MSKKFEVYQEDKRNSYHYYKSVTVKDAPKSLYPRTALTDYKNKNIVSLQSLTTGKKAQIRYYTSTEEIRKRLEYEDNDKENIIIKRGSEYVDNTGNCNEKVQKATGKIYYDNEEQITKSTQTEKPHPSSAKVKNEVKFSRSETKTDNYRSVPNKPQVRTTNEQQKKVSKKEKIVPQSYRVPGPSTAPKSICKPSTVRDGSTKPQHHSVPPKVPPLKPILKCATTEDVRRTSSEKKISFKDQLNEETNHDVLECQDQEEKANRVVRVFKVDMRHVTVRRPLEDDYYYKNDDEMRTKPENADATWIEDESEKLKFLNKIKFTENFETSYDGFAVDKLFYPYIEDVVTYLRRLEYKYVLRKSLFSNQPESGSPQTRMLTINFMLRLMDLKRIPLGAFLKSIILFDNVLHVKLISPNRQLLVGLVCLWLSVKNECGILRKASEIANLINNKYTAKEILEMEIAILTFFKGDFNFPDPTDFVAYLIYKWLGFESPVFNHIVNYTLICFCMHSGFSTISPSHQAAAVVHLASQFFTKNRDMRPWSVLSQSACYYSEIEIKNVQVVMHKQIKKFTTSDSQFYPYVMYSTADKLKLSSLLAKKLEKRGN